MSFVQRWIERRVRLALGDAGPALNGDASTPEFVADLTDDIEPVLRLMENPGWRHRLVETVVLRDGDHARVHSSFQVEFASDFLQMFDIDERSAVNLLLPLTTRPKQALIDFDVRVNAERGRSYLLPRSQIARVQAEYLHRLALTSEAGNVVERGLPFPLLEAICVFTPGPWIEIREERALEDGIAHYLQRAGMTYASTDHVHRWLRTLGPVAEALRQFCREPTSELDSASIPLLALPELLPGDRPETARSVTNLVARYAEAVSAATDAADAELLGRLGIWGVRWPVIVETTVAAGKPSLIKLSEDRRLDFRARGLLAHRLELADARSAHLEVRLEDHEVVLTDAFQMEDPEGGAVDIPTILAARVTEEALTFYSSSDEPRPPWVTAIISVAPAKRLRVTMTGASVLTLTATAAATWVGCREPADELAVLALPISIVAGLLVTREATPLAARLLRRHRVWLGIVSVLFWMAILARLSGFHPFTGA